MTSLKLTIVNKRRFTAFCTVMALICVASIAAFAGNNSVSASDQKYEMIYVGNGDTLWSIAKEIYTGSGDIRSVVAEIKDINDMHNNTIYPGDVLYVPVY